MSKVEPLLKMQGITKEFPGVMAVNRVDFDLMAGEVHALVGENGAGKSTLIKILSGAIPKTAGDIFLNGEKVDIANPKQAQTLGIAVIYQELMLAPSLSAAENIFLGCLPRKWKLFVDKKTLLTRAQHFATMLGLTVDLRWPLYRLTIAQQQMIEVAKALALHARIIIMDEPSAVLTPLELEKLFAIIGQLKKNGVSFIYISHRLDEIFRIADRVTVLRDGTLQGTQPTAAVTRDEIIRMMVGRELGSGAGDQSSKKTSQIALEVSGLCSSAIRQPISLKVHCGEILGIAGLVGAGRTQLVRAIFGADRLLSGTIRIDGQVVHIPSPAAAVRLGLALVPEDRKIQGIFPAMSTLHNMTITNLPALSRRGVIKRRAEGDAATHLLHRLQIRLHSLQQPITSLSGGNQQKAILARWLATKARIFIFDEPTRGIDVAAKAQIHDLMRELSRQGAGIIMVSSDLPEILALSDRILVMHAGTIRGELARDEATEEKIMALAMS
ncbi:MAG: sugar ABC transporter ATP-binding protein [candidate division KSB1 bacterium]|nr:sugar ABC transporter ATP-binding protein [candidate division KSB1 bacterium]MDZ7341034.1 sugar ABC transporter ATP-binding protein [candidate division KSB1 bacterium]